MEGTLALFDVDGTLVRAGDTDHHRAFVDAVAEIYGVTIDLGGVDLAGMIDRAICRVALDAAGVDAHDPSEIDSVMHRMGVLYRQRVNRGDRTTWVLPGVTTTLERLGSGPVTIGVLSGNAASVGWWKLEAAHLAHHFRLGSWGDEADERWELVPLAMAKLDRHYDDVVLIGDTTRDVEAARRSGARMVAVATGVHDAQRLREAGADVILDSLADVESAAEAILGVR